MKDLIRELRIYAAELSISVAYYVAPKNSDIAAAIIEYFEKQINP